MSLNQEFIQRLDQSREQIRAALASYPIDREIYSPWKTKEMLSHLTGWDDAAIDFILGNSRLQLQKKGLIKGYEHHADTMFAALFTLPA